MPESDWDITTGDGSVALELPDGFNGELDAHTGDGSIRMNDITVSNVSGTITRNNVRGRLGAGGRSVRVRTGDGSISCARASVRKRPAHDDAWLKPSPRTTVTRRPPVTNRR